MNRVLWLDCSAGVSGDMLLGALIDAGADPDRLRKGLERLDLRDWALRFEVVRRGGLRALRAIVEVHGAEADSAHVAGQPPVPHTDERDRGHAHRPWREVRARIEAAGLPERARDRALAAYARLATAEARLHDVPVEEVELHEVGATDAIVDICGVCLALEDLRVSRIAATPLPMGTGRVSSAHGSLPLPAPATLALLEGWPLVPAPREGEWVTPTGAALISALAAPEPFPAMRLVATGHGAGRHDPPGHANLVRACVGEASREPGTAEGLEIVACNLDDFEGQLIPPLMDHLFATGALDVWSIPVLMKKGRPGLVVEALCTPERAPAVVEALLRHSSTLGARRTPVERHALERWTETVETPYGPVRVKVGGRGHEAWHAAPEYEDVAARAREASIPPREVHAAAVSAWYRVNRE